MTKKVMLIDDDLDDHVLFAEHLAAFTKNIELVPVYNGVVALRVLESIMPDWIFLDINMPSMNGMDVLKKLHEKGITKEIPVYMYSTSDGYNSKVKALKLGATKYFQKPFNPDEYMEMFTEVFGAQF